MSLFNFILALAVTVLISAVINQVVRGVSMPLVQIALGVFMSLLGFISSSFTVDPELFLVLFIAPLLYDEARTVDKVALWSNRVMILSLAICLVVVTFLCVGFALHFFQPSIPLAACFALGAALGPTDAVAVASLSQRASLNKQQEVLLSGESLINDASGVVSFQFAVAALTTGAFSLVDATATFTMSFFGGIFLGILCALVISFVVSRVRSAGLEDTTFHVLFEVCTPFAVFLVAEHMHVSGILAVVAAGLLGSFLNRDIGPNMARMKIVSASVWRVLGFVLNGVVFVLLGAQLPRAMTDTWQDRSVSNPELIGLVLLIAAIVIGVRMLWFIGIGYASRKSVAKKEQANSGGSPEQVRAVMKSVKAFTKASLRESCAMALAGPKGAITLSIMFTLPYFMDETTLFADRDLLIFLASGVILLTLLLANFVLPVLLPKEKQDNYQTDTQATIFILRRVIEELTARQTKENRRATQVVLKQYSDRLDRIKQGTDLFDETDSSLRMQVLQWEQERAVQAIVAEEVAPVVGYRLLRRINQAMRLASHERSASWALGFVHSKASLAVRMVKRTVLDTSPLQNAFEKERQVRELQASCLEFALNRLRVCLNETTYPVEHVSLMMLEVQRDLRRVRRMGRDIGTVTHVEDKATEVRRTGYLLELEHIQEMYELGRISRVSAKHMRENVHLMQLDLEDKV